MRASSTSPDRPQRPGRVKFECVQQEHDGWITSVVWIWYNGAWHSSYEFINHYCGND